MCLNISLSLCVCVCFVGVTLALAGLNQQKKSLPLITLMSRTDREPQLASQSDRYSEDQESYSAPIRSPLPLW